MIHELPLGVIHELPLLKEGCDWEVAPTRVREPDPYNKSARQVLLLHSEKGARQGPEGEGTSPLHRGRAGRERLLHGAEQEEEFAMTICWVRRVICDKWYVIRVRGVKGSSEY